MEHGGDLGCVAVDVEVGVVGQAARHRVDRRPDCDGHDSGIEVAAELSLGLDAGEVLLEDLHGIIDVCVASVTTLARIASAG